MLFNFNDLVKIDIVNPPSAYREYVENELHFIEPSSHLVGEQDVIFTFRDDLQMHPEKAQKVIPPVGYDKEGVFWFDPNNEIARVNFNDFQKGTTSINVSTGFNTHFLYILVLYSLSFKALLHGGTFFHASAVNYKGQSLLFPAWRHVGKTNLMLALLQDGAELIADDGVILFNTGEFMPFSRRMNLLYFNFLSFPELLDKASPKMKELKSFMDTARNGEFGLSEKSKNLFQKLIREKIPNNAISGADHYPKKYKVDQVIHLNKKITSENKAPSLQEIDRVSLVNKSTETTLFELSHFITAYQISALTQNHQPEDFLDNASSNVRNVFNEGLKHAKGLFDLSFSNVMPINEVKSIINDKLEKQESSSHHTGQK